jgi:aerobic-type carbon monoxide dehydrogenase small subunit (CoxS/CutS family)
MTSFRLNGQNVKVDSTPLTPLLDVLRDEIGDTSPKPGCREGRCGACTVLLDGEPVVSCLVPLTRAAGADVVTVRGLGTDENLSAIQEAFARAGAVQCGICTPGMVVATHALLQETPNPSEPQIRAALVNNLCRCTGYLKIIEAVASLAREDQAHADG